MSQSQTKIKSALSTSKSTPYTRKPITSDTPNLQKSTISHTKQNSEDQIQPSSHNSIIEDDPQVLPNSCDLFTEKQKVLLFYKQLLQQHQDSHKLSLISIQLTKLVNIILGLQPQSDILKEFYNLVNILIYPQKLKFSSQTDKSQQQRVRDIILYLKVIRQVLFDISDDQLFTLSDVIDESCLNQQGLIHHVMFIWEKVVGKQILKCSQLSAYEVLQLQKDLEPLMNKQIQTSEYNTQESHKQAVDVKDLEQQYYGKLKYMEQKLRAYKGEYAKIKQFCQKQDAIIRRYEDALQNMSQKKETIQNEQNIKSKIFSSFLNSLKDEYMQDLKALKSDQKVIKQDQSDISNSPINLKNTTNKIEQSAKFVQTDEDLRIQELEDLRKDLLTTQKENSLLNIEKRELLREKHNFSEKFSVLQGQVEDVQEKLDKKSQKYQKVKKELQRIAVEGQNNQTGIERLKEEVVLLCKQKNETESRTKRFESQFRQGLKEIDELREQIDQLQSNPKVKDKDIDNDFGGSENSSFMIFNQSNHHDIKITELEKEKEILLQKILLLEKSNKELLSYKRSLEETIQDVSKEEDGEKRMSMANFNLIRKKSLLRFEQSQIFNENKFQSPEKSDKQSTSFSSNQYLGQRQSMFDQYTPGNKSTFLAPPNSVQNNQQQLQNTSHLSQNYQSVPDRPQDLNNILDQIQQLDSQRTTPAHQTLTNIALQDEQDQISQQTHLQDTRNEIVVHSLFGIVNNDSRAESLQFIMQQSQEQDNSEEQEEEEGKQTNILSMQLKKTSSKKDQKRLSNQGQVNQKEVIKEVEGEDEYDEEDESSEDNIDQY